MRAHQVKSRHLSRRAGRGTMEHKVDPEIQAPSPSARFKFKRGDFVKRNLLAFPILMSLVLLCSCANKEATTDTPLPHATLRLRDGSKVAGQVKSTSPTEITLIGDDNSARTYPMAQVKSIVYDDAAPTGGAAGSNQSAARSSESESSHENHYHPNYLRLHL